MRDFNPSLPDHCDPTGPFFVFLSSHLGTCVPTPLALLSTILGFLSILSWLFAQLPQIVKNYALQSTSGLSSFFLVEWCLGDSTNLVGALFTGQAVWQVVVAGYYVCVDVVLVGQYAWYSHLKPRREARRVNGRWRKNGRSPEDDGDIIEGVSVESSGSYDSSHWKPTTRDSDNKHPTRPRGDRSSRQSSANPISFSRPLTRTLLISSLWSATASAHPLIFSPTTTTTSSSAFSTETIGRILSWSSTILYLCSRLPQLYKNHVRRSTAGLSAKLFIAAFFGNLFYSCSLLTNPCAWSDLPPYGGGGWVGPDGSDRADWTGRAAPFFLGAAGVLALDAAVGVQFLLFGEGECEGSSGCGQEEVVDERGRWKKVEGWMRGWVPSVRARDGPVSEREHEREVLLGQTTDGSGAESTRYGGI